MLIVFCISNLSIPQTITLLEGHYPNVIVITDHINIFQYLTKIYGKAKIVYLEHFEINKNPFSIFKFFLYRKQLWKKFKYLSQNDIYFFFNAFGLYESYLLKKLAKNNSIYYSKDININCWQKHINIRSFIMVLEYYLLFDVIITPLFTGDRFIPSVSKKFLKQIKARETNINVNTELIDEIQSKNFVLDHPNILFLTGGVIENKIIRQEDFIYYNDLLIKKISNYKIVLKNHPRYPEKYSLENELSEIPSYVPANMIISYFNCVIGYSSAVLFEAANCGKTAISTINYYPTSNQNRKKSYRRYLELNLSENRKIFFPNTVEEIIELINNVVKLK